VIRFRLAAVAVAAALLTGCAVVPKPSPMPAQRPPPPQPSAARVPSAPAAQAPGPSAPLPPQANARSTGVRAGPAVAQLGLTTASARAALMAFRISCPSLQKRADGSGLTSPADWTAACLAASTWSDDDAPAFFAQQFESVIVGDGRAFATGYYEPEIAGARTRQPGYEVPVYGRPADLVDVDLGLFSDPLKGRRIRGRVEGNALVPYHDRAAIEAGAIAATAPVIAWAADPVEFFFLQVQGSGRLRLPDGTVMRIGYETQNGRDYTGIGALLRDRGVLAPGQASMQGIMAYLRAEPDGGRAIMHENRSFVFFRALTGAGPLGALGLPVSPRATVAADPLFVPLGAPIFLSLDRPEANGLWIAQDIGGAIKGPNRVDTFWGAGDEARRIAGGMSGRGQAWLLLPLGTLARLGGDGGGAAAQR
jgi:membrane-bound lytic murein transglycosylase A